MKVLFSNCLGDYSYRFQGPSDLTALQLQFPCSPGRRQPQEIIPLRDSQEFCAIAVT